MDSLFHGRLGATGRCVFALGASALLNACGGSGDEDVDTQGSVSIFPGLAVSGLSRDVSPDQVPVPLLAAVSTFREESFPGEGGSVRVSTLQYEPGYTVQGEIDWRLGQDVIGSCTFEDDETEGDGGDDSSSPPYVSAGASVVISSPRGLWAEIPIGDDLQYRLEPNLGPLPAGATLSIPGDIFPPTAGGYPLGEPQAPVRISPALGANVDFDTSFTWQPSSDSNSTIAVDFLEYDVNDEFIGFPFYCFTEDDGEFALPPDVAVSLAAQTNDIKVRYSRISRRIDVVDGVLFYQRNSVAE